MLYWTQSMDDDHVRKRLVKFRACPVQAIQKELLFRGRKKEE